MSNKNDGNIMPYYQYPFTVELLTYDIIGVNKKYFPDSKGVFSVVTCLNQYSVYLHFITVQLSLYYYMYSLSNKSVSHLPLIIGIKEQFLPNNHISPFTISTHIGTQEQYRC